MLDEAGGHPECVAISITGVIDPETRRIKCANIPCIDGRELVAELERELHLPIKIANDADCFALAEAGAGAGRVTASSSGRSSAPVSAAAWWSTAS